MSAQAATTETSAVRRCGLMPEGYGVRRRSVPAPSAEPAEGQSEDDQDEAEDQALPDQNDDANDQQDCAYTHAVSSLEVAPQGLFTFDRFEQCLEIAFSKPAGAVALDDFEEERRAVLRRLREDLEQVALLVAVGEDAQALQIVVVGVDLADALFEVVVVRGRASSGSGAPLLELLDSGDDVVGRHRDVLNPGPP